MTDREPDAPPDKSAPGPAEPEASADRDTPAIEPEATEVAAVPPPDENIEPETDFGDDEMAEGVEDDAANVSDDEDAEAGEDAEDDLAEPDEIAFADDDAAIGAEADDEVVETAGAAGAARTGSGLGGRLRPAGAPAVAATPSERAVHIDDRISQVVVLAIVVTFVGIFLYAAVAGHGGFLTPTVTPSPSAEESASPSASPSVSIEPSASGSAAPSASPSGSGGSASPAPSGSGTPPPS